MRMTSDVQTVSPAKAKEWLEANRSNRNLKPNTVKKYAADMKAGKWKLTHQGIAFDEKGKLLDGQHRLTAIVESGATVKLTVTNGVPADSFDVMDDGSNRIARDLLSIAMPGQAFTTEIASIARGMLVGFAQQGGRGPTKQEVLAFALDAKEHIEPYISIQKKMRSGLASAFANADYMAGVPRELLFKVRDDMLSLTFSGDKDPIKHLYRRCTDNSSSRTDAVNLRYRLGVTALRAVIEGRQLSVIFEAQRDWEVNEYKKTMKKKAAA